MADHRPLSPHITVHKWILSQIMSITHRSAAIIYSFGMLFISLWLLSLSFGPKYYSIFQLFFFNIIGRIIIFFFIFCFFFYFIEELRRFFWGFGLGLNIKTIKITNYIVIFCSVTISVLFFLLLI